MNTPESESDPLAYADSPGGAAGGARRVLRWGRALLIVGLVLAAVALVELGCDQGRRHEMCANCGATRTVACHRLFGLGTERVTDSHAGPVSRFIERQRGAPCRHQWEPYEGTGGSFFRRWAGSYRGLGRALAVGSLEGYPSADDVLSRRAREDAGFFDALTKALRFDDEESDLAFFQELSSEAEAALDAGR